jgi:prepilin peptidase CpaA
MPEVSYILIAAVAVYTAACAIADARTQRIPNYLTVPAAAAGLAYHAFFPSGWGALSALAGFSVGFLVLLLPWFLGGGGMGDVKLLAALGAWLGPQWILVAFAASAVLAAFMAIGVLALVSLRSGVHGARQRVAEAQRPTSSNSPRKRRQVLPFAIPVAAGTWGVLIWFVSHGAW